jgi:hypothetical protein
MGAAEGRPSSRRFVQRWCRPKRMLCVKGEITPIAGSSWGVGKVHHLARFTPAGDLKPVERIHSVLGIFEAKASQGQTFEGGRLVSCNLKDRPTFPVRTQIEG